MVMCDNQCDTKRNKSLVKDNIEPLHNNRIFIYQKHLNPYALMSYIFFFFFFLYFYFL